MKKILIIQTAFLGDVVLATALLENLHSCLPDTKISLLVREGNESLFNNHPFLHEVIVWKKKSGKLKSLISVIQKVRSNSFDIVLNLQRFLSSGLIAAFSGADIKIGFHKNPLSFTYSKKVKHVIGDGRHEVERNRQLVEHLCKNINNIPKLYPAEADFDKVSSWKSNSYITIAPASVWFTKQFPENKWVELIDKADSNFSVYLVGSPADKELCERIATASKHQKVKNLAGDLSLLQTAALMKDARMNYVNDSAPLHIASAMNASVSAIFCSTVPEFGFGPLSDNSVVIETTEKLECRPCGLHGKRACPLGHFRCATTILIPTP